MAQFGISMFPTDTTISPIDLAKAAEERGFDHLFFPEHTHIPVSRKTPFPGGGDLPEWYWRSHDPFVALTAAAAVTEKLMVGTGICLVIERDPIVLAKECASLDVLSNGRFILGIGAGWNQEEMENHGANFPHRWKVVREKMLAMKAIWTEDEAEYHGEFVDFDPIWSWPKPITAGGPPIWMGANSKWVYDRVAEYCDGWMPIGGSGSGGMGNMSAALERVGRSMDGLNIALFGAPPDVEQCRGRIAQGYTDLVFSLPQTSEDKVIERLDKITEIVRQLRS